MPDLFDPEVFSRTDNPFPALARLREEDPVHWSPKLKGWVLTRYDDIRKVMRDPQYSVDRLRPFFDSLDEAQAATLPDLRALIPLWLVFRNPPDHTLLRRIMNPAFLPAAIKGLRPKLIQLVDELIDAFAATGRVEFISEFALPLPGFAILDLLGMPRSDLAVLKPWSNDLQLFIGGSQSSTDKYAIAQRGTQQMAQYFRDVVRHKRAHPGTDLVSMLIAARDKGQQLTEDDLISTCILLLFGGHETTTNMLGNSLVSLVRNPAQLEELRRNPELVPSAVEECLRYDGPSGAAVRIVTSDHELGGKTLRRGDRIFAMLLAANRDPARFDNPDVLDIRRANNAHVTFGLGAHVCLGAPLARLEGTLALSGLIARLQNIRIEADELPWRDAIVMRGVAALPLTFDSAAAN